MKIILHIDFNSYFATVEQQANPRLRGKPIGVTGGPARNALACEAGGDRVKRTVLGAASIEAKKFGIKTGMQIWEAKKLCPQIILVPGDSDKYLETTKRFLNILKDYSPYLEVFSIDECFLELLSPVIARNAVTKQSSPEIEIATSVEDSLLAMTKGGKVASSRTPQSDVVRVAQEIKSRIKQEIGEYITCSVGISYNKLMAKLAGSLQKPDGLVVIANQEEAIKVLDRIELDEICGIGPRIKKRLNNLGVSNFSQLRQVPLKSLLASFKGYGQTLYNMARGIDHSPVVPFYEKEEVKSIGHRHTIDHDTNDPEEIKQILFKLSEMIARRLRSKNLTGKTVHCWYREAFACPVIPSETRNLSTPTLSSVLDSIGIRLRPTYVGDSSANRLRMTGENQNDKENGNHFTGDGMQTTVLPTDDGLEIFRAAWKIFHQIWPARNALACETGGNTEKIRMIGVSVSNLISKTPQNLSFLPEEKRKEVITKALDKINDRYGEFTLQRGVLLTSAKIRRKPNPFLSDRRFKL